MVTSSTDRLPAPIARLVKKPQSMQRAIPPPLPGPPPAARSSPRSGLAIRSGLRLHLRRLECQDPLPGTGELGPEIADPAGQLHHGLLVALGRGAVVRLEPLDQVEQLGDEVRLGGLGRRV